MKIEISLIVISCYLTLIAAKCPSPAVIAPCKCETNSLNTSSIFCGGNTTYNLRSIFTFLSSSVNDDEKHFRMFYFNNTAINELAMNIFYDITFEEVLIDHAYNLTKINSHAFIPTITHLKRFSIYDTPYGGNTTDTNDFFGAINTMINVEGIDIDNTSLTTIPSNGFTLLNKLKVVQFFDNAKLSSLGNYAFYELNNLTYLGLRNNSIDYIPDHALSFRNRLNETMVLDIDYMYNLTIKTFSNATFASVNRRYLLRLISDPQLKYLDDTIFQPILVNGNQIYLYNTRLECGCRMYWLYANRAQYEPLVHSAYCTDGNSIFTERQNYTNCDVSALKMFYF